MQRKRVFLILTIVWMVFIFLFSARDGSTSEQDSYRVGMLAGKLFVADFGQKSEAEQLAFAQKVDHPIRKTAHATEYAVLGMLIFGAYVDGKKRNGYKVLVPWLGAALYAATDEFHQLFVPGRSGQVTDVMIDSAGAAVGVVVLVLIYGMIKSKGVEETNG